MANNYLNWMNPYGDSYTGTPIPVQPNYMQNYQVPAQKVSSSVVWVQGEVGAKAYSVAPGNTVILMDSESNKFYMKSVDLSGKPSIRTYSYDEVVEAEKVSEDEIHNDYVSRKEFDELKKQLDELMA